MARRSGRSIGIAIFISCVVGFIVYAWLLLVSEWSGIVLRLTVLAFVAALLSVVAWIGLTMASTPASTEERLDSTQLRREEAQK